MLDDAESLLRAEEAIAIPGIEVLGLYGVLGAYDFVSIVEAPNNKSAAEFSLELGVRAGAHIATLPAIPIARFDSGPRAASAVATTEPDVAVEQLLMQRFGSPSPGSPAERESHPRSDS